MEKRINLNDRKQVIDYVQESEREKALLVKSLEEALDLLRCAGPNPICIDSIEYFERLDSLRESLGLNNEDEDE